MKKNNIQNKNKIKSSNSKESDKNVMDQDVEYGRNHEVRFLDHNNKAKSSKHRCKGMPCSLIEE